MTFRCFLPALFLLAAMPAIAAEPSGQADVQKVVDQFQTALKAHDGATIRSLFLPDTKAWWTTLGDASYKKVKEKHPEVMRFKAGTYQEFADYVTNAKESVEERFHNVRIQTDGAIASVYFDFEFLSGGKVANHGAETWQLIRTDDGWKIASMLYSSNF